MLQSRRGRPPPYVKHQLQSRNSLVGRKVDALDRQREDFQLVLASLDSLVGLQTGT